MMKSIPVRRLAAITGLCMGLALACPQGLFAAEPPPEVSKEGLHLTKKTKTRLVYLKPGATFTQYNRVAILDCYVEFAKNWQRDYNNSQRDPARRVRDSDIERAKKELSEQFKKVFTEELQTKGGYQVVDSAAPDVLLLRPALINIEVSAPDLMAPGRSVTFVQSSGQMTIYLELWDSATNTILARVMDAQVDPDIYRQRSSSVSNRAAADWIMKRWAQEFRERLDAVRGKAGGS